MRKEKKAVKKQNIFLNNIGLNLGIRLPRIQTYIAKNPFIILIFYSLASEISCIYQHKFYERTSSALPKVLFMNKSFLENYFSSFLLSTTKPARATRDMPKREAQSAV